ncbi:MAG: valine--tRNA ligase [Patescibacteria group bacterium]
MKELPKAYEPKRYEDEIYRKWEESGFFNPDGLSGEPYSIMMPPPNVTGVLHLGHALENALMDTMARYQRMRGKKVLLVPGTDHAALPTQAKVEKLLMQEGIKNPRQELGREKLVAKIKDFAENSKSTILGQIKKMGTSCDWSRLAYTFDGYRSKAVNEMFKRMYDDGLIYRGYRVVNWSVKGQSTCSDDEVIHVERPAKLYTFKYSKDFPIMIATTRPETKLGDTAVAVNPGDDRYKMYIGKKYQIDIGAALPLQIKIIADENVEINFGTGALGVTPAHSPTDFEIYEKQKAKDDPIGLIPVIGSDGLMTDAAGINYQGLTVEVAREKFVAWLKENSLLEKEDDIIQNVGTSDRFGDVIEAIPMTQWWLDMRKEIPGRDKSLKDLMRLAVTTGLNNDPAQKVFITPERFKKLYLDRILNLRDWCLSRQIWWGHRIPVWYCVGDGACKIECKQPIVTLEKPDYCPHCNSKNIIQDEDTLDTWFSSGLWTFSTLGWPDKTEDMKKFHPTSWIQMGYEIRDLWMMRMILMSSYALKQIPFKNVYFHGMLRDESGKKFSKSSGNNIDPLDVIKQYGADALRWSVLGGIAPGNDSKFYEEKIEGARNLVNKLWNISRFMVARISEPGKDIVEPKPKTLADQWIMSRLAGTVETVKENIEKYNFSYAGEALRDFTWNDLADWYLEIAKVEGDKSETLNYILNTILKLWHPFMPFVTEAIWNEAYNGSMLMVEKWPVANQEKISLAVEADFGIIQKIIVQIRNWRAEHKIEPKEKIKAVITFGRDLIPANGGVIKFFGRLETLAFVKKTVTGEATDFEIKFDCQVDANKEMERLRKEIAAIEPYVASQEKKLANEQFVGGAPATVVAGERKKLAEAKEKLAKLNEQLIK